MCEEFKREGGALPRFSPWEGKEMGKKLICPKCGGDLTPMERLPRFLMCLICGIAVTRVDAETHAMETGDGEET